MKNKTYSKMKSNLTQAELKAQFDYDAKNGWLIRKYRNEKPYNKPAGYKANTSAGYSAIGINGKIYYSHRLIWLYHYGEFPSEFIDHIDGNKMNNRIENLRAADQNINCHNHKLQKNNTSGFPGVRWHRRVGKYYVSIRVDCNDKFIGYFQDFEEAVLASKKAKIQYHPTSPIAQKYREELGID